MPIDRTMSVSLSDESRRTIVTFRRSGSQVIVETWQNGEPHEHPVTAAELSQLASFLGDLATTRWSDPTAADPATSPLPAEPTVPEVSAARASTLPPYPQSARWVPAPAGGASSSPDNGRD